VTAAVRCAPPANRPTPEERDRCQPFLDRELSLLSSARVFVALGQYAYDALNRVLPLGRRPRFGHGVETPAGEGRTVICSYHPSQQNTFTGKLTAPMLDAVFTRARQLAAAPDA
jgi:uracil-DNA glycosylase family 4